MEPLGLDEHLSHPTGWRRELRGARSGAAGGAGCGDVVRIDLAVEGATVAGAAFDAGGCGTTVAAGSAACHLAAGGTLLGAARLGAADIAAELGGLSPGKLHAAELAADALHRALGEAARHDAQAGVVPGRVLVAMSGGVDSAAAALLTARAGGGPVAVTLELWADPENDAQRSCCSAVAVRRARALAHGMGLPHLTLDLRAEFRAGVVDPWLAGHAAGATPNPCVACNGRVRIDAMLDLAERLGAPALATGHYARVHDDGQGPLLRAAADPAKDQSYVLAALRPSAVARLQFPLGELEKPEVRALAAAAGLPVADAPDSQDLCFLAGTGRAAFLSRHGGLGEQPGEIVDAAGRVLGEHGGHHGFTVGQRRGLGLGGGAPRYVLATDAAANRVTVGPRASLATRAVRLQDAVLHRDAARAGAIQLRAHGPRIPAAVAGLPAPGSDGEFDVALAEPAVRPAPGQAGVLYDGELVVGHGTAAPARVREPAAAAG
ncbi:MAG: tRNA 2-thiouridine(34) synthase MnmA [Solirubrobacteraceae bacterium]